MPLEHLETKARPKSEVDPQRNFEDLHAMVDKDKNMNLKTNSKQQRYVSG